MREIDNQIRNFNWEKGDNYFYWFNGEKKIEKFYKYSLKNTRLAKSISDVSWDKFIDYLSYKSEWYDRKLIKIDTFFPSSQLCSNCGDKNKEVKYLSIREWECPECHSIHDRDMNAIKIFYNKVCNYN